MKKITKENINWGLSDEMNALINDIDISSEKRVLMTAGDKQFIYDDESIVQYILSLIHYNLEKNRVHDLEKVINYNILNLMEKNGIYTVTIITRELKNIVLFQENA